MPAAKRARWTRAEVEKLIEENPLQTPRYELVDGELFVTPSPAPLHQRIVSELWAPLREYVRANRLGRVYTSRSDILLETETFVQPDLYVVPSAEDKRLNTAKQARTLTLAIEVLSPSSARGDRGKKRLLYQRRVPEYWIVDPDARIVERWRPEDDRPEIIREVLTWQPTATIEPLRVDLPALFADAFGEAESDA